MIPLRDLNPSHRAPLVTVVLIAANALLFVYELTLGPDLERFLFSAAFIPAKVLAGEGAGGGIGFGLGSGLLSMFLHGGWMHFLGNMLFLWIFGDNVEDRLGHLRFLLFYLLCGYAATFAHAAASPASAVPAIGASGAIAGVLGAYILMFPQSRVNVLVGRQIVAMPAFIVLGLWIALQLVSGVGTIATTDESAGGIAYMAHIGGFVSGFLMTFLFRGRESSGIAT